MGNNMKFTVTYYEVNAISVSVDAENKSAAINLVQNMMEEGIDYDSPSVTVDYSHTLDKFEVYEDIQGF